MSSRLPIFFIVATVTIDAMGIGLIMPVMPDLLREVDGGNLSQAAIWGGILATTFAVMQFLFGPIIGSLSDQYGRKPILVISLVIMSIVYALSAIAGSIWILFVGRIIGGVSAATHATAAAYMADVSKPDEKAANFGLIGAGFGIGFVLGPVVGGLLAEFGTRAPFWAAAVLAMSNAALGWFVLHESVTDATRRAFTWKRANPFGAFKSITSFPGLGPLLLVYFFYQIGTVVYPSVWAFYGVERFEWSPSMIGVSLAVFGLCFAFVQGALVQPSIRRFGHRKTVVIGLALEATTLFIVAGITSGNILLLLIPFTALGAVGMPALQGIMSRRVSDDAQGEFQGVLTSVNSLAAIMAPLVMTRSFAYFTAPEAPVYLPGAPFIIAGTLMMIAVVIFQMRKRSSAAS
ncbi:TCR/Tet family MFS transporter [Planktotalea sp.]|uniref:TCR/Tet family MFS transporter n=1 Tax=Planktotalea sp. TaxID=2029877 RepID=UPI0025F912FB|nr:TCR/Tet family MFS transporter [Planktotalea sp.]